MKNNVLMTDDNHPVFIDFGLSGVIESLSSEVTSSLARAGNPRWMAPEVQKDGQGARSIRSDVYAFAGLCLEVSSCPLELFRHLLTVPVIRIF